MLNGYDKYCSMVVGHWFRKEDNYLRGIFNDHFAKEIDIHFCLAEWSSVDIQI